MITPKGRILCTEDDDDTRELIILTLRQGGYEVVYCADPQKAVSLLKRQAFDLILVDMRMKGLTGIEFTRHVRGFDQETPILFFSGATDSSNRGAARVAGAQGYLVKPAPPAELIKEITRLISDSRERKSTS